MKAIELWDCDRQGFLALKQVLAALPERAVTSRWEMVDFVYPNGEAHFDVASAGDDHLSRLANTGKSISSKELVAIATSSPQVIWGTFRGFDRSDSKEPWILLHAVDSTFWRCETRDIATRQKLMKTFRDVRLSEQ
ncbi:hypothetical protein PRN20_09315 [Devosia sp. ZB163]|uniref:hypothetical protein n=1 Tax=Devosia sp. ZB163 TaxID=3025938 RepID=UPI00235E8400|nr:hypothetical protein [Devosia sp. ZB163]MDC9823933.1 hypothetical protein [Devosia sp. ZB163]